MSIRGWKRRAGASRWLHARLLRGLPLIPRTADCNSAHLRVLLGGLRGPRPPAGVWWCAVDRRRSTQEPRALGLVSPCRCCTRHTLLHSRTLTPTRTLTAVLLRTSSLLGVCMDAPKSPKSLIYITHTTKDPQQQPTPADQSHALVPRALPRTPQPQPPAATGSRARALATGETGQGNTRTRDWRPMQIPAPQARQSARRAHAPTRARADAPRTHARTRACAHARTHAHKQAHKHMTAHTQDG